MRKWTTAARLFVTVRIDERQELLPGLGLVAENAEHPAGDQIGASLADAAVDHAMMRRLDHHGDAGGFSTSSTALAICAVSRSGICNRLEKISTTRASLEIPTTRPVRDVADPYAADDRRDMMFAMALERDAAQDDHLVIAVDFLNVLCRTCSRVLVVAAKYSRKARTRRLGVSSDRRYRGPRRST